VDKITDHKLSIYIGMGYEVWGMRCGVWCTGETENRDWKKETGKLRLEAFNLKPVAGLI
jgi:hypothetical protein